MSWNSFPSWTPAPLRRHVVLLVEWLRLANALKRSRGEWIVLAVAAVGLIALFWSRVVTAVHLVADYWLLSAVATAVFVASSIARRRRKIHELHLQSWLVAAPIPKASVRASQTIRTLLPAIAQFSGVAVISLLAAETHVAGRVIGAIGVGLLVGVVMGWRAGIDRSGDRAPASRYVRFKRTGVQALSAWPIAQVLAWSRPENARYVLIVALFAVQGGSSAMLGISVVALYFIGSYLTALLSAVVSVARSASAWLRSTPMALSEFVWILSRRALLHQVVGTTLAASFMLLVGAPVMPMLQLAAVWLSLVVSISGCALLDCYRGRSPAMKITICFIVWGAVLTVLQMRSAVRT